MSPRLAPTPQLVAGVFCCAISVAGAAAQVESKQTYNLPRGDAATTLSQFARASGRQVVFMMDKVRGEQTNAIAGEFSPPEALGRMLAGTGLVAVQDDATGAFVIKRNASPSSGSQSPKPEAAPPTPMKRKNLLAALTTWITLSLAPGHAAENPSGVTRHTGGITGRVQNVVTGQFLHNARVAVRETELVVFTDQSGTYFLNRVPAGTVLLEVAYTGLDSQQIAVRLSPAQTLVQDVDLTSVSRYGDRVMKLAAFTVSSARETDGEAIATNEQRYSPNIKTVIAADALGDVQDGNVGEFLKFLPGVTAEYDSEAGGTVAAISVRGLGSNVTTVSSDGVQMANTSNALGATRSFQFGQVSMNNVSRIEVTKVPAPSHPADSLAGSVNMVSKSAFERKTAQLRYSVSLSANHESIDLRRTPDTRDERTFKVLPSVNFDYTLPVSKDFGLVLTALSTNRQVQQHPSRKVYNAAGTGTGASFASPFLQTYRLVNSPRVTSRNSVGVRADWRVMPHGVLSAAVQASHFESHRIANELLLNTGTNANPTPATGSRLSYGDNFTNGATGRGTVTMGGAASVNQILATTAANLRYRFDNGDWRIETGINQSFSKGGYRDTAYGHFRQFGITLVGPSRVSFSDVRDVSPGKVQVFDNNSREIDLYDINNYRLSTATSTPRDIRDGLKGANIDVRREMAWTPFPAAVQIGSRHRVQTRDVTRQSMAWTYNGPDGNPATPDSPAPYLNSVYVNQDDHFGFRNLPWPSLFKAWRAFEDNPMLFSKTPAQIVSEQTAWINNSEYLREKVSALYLQTEMSLLKSRLKVLTGVRYERTTDLGKGPLYDPAAVFARDPDGSFVRDFSGNRVRRPEAGEVGSLQEVRLTRRERGYQAERSYDGYYPSLHLTYAIRENVLARAAYAKTYGRPDFTEIIPNSTISEADLDDSNSDPTLVLGTIDIRNTGLKPWSAHNIDLSLEYYTAQGGVLSAGVFLKEIEDFFGDEVKIATADDLRALGLDPRYEGWQLSTKFNSGAAQVSGVEVNVRQSLQSLGRWGRHVYAFANGTTLHLEGNRRADFTSFIKQSANWGFTFSKEPVTFMAKWNYRGEQAGIEVRSLGPDAVEYTEARTTLDVSLDYQIKRYLVLYGSAQNIFNAPQAVSRYGSATPAYARRYLTTDNAVQLTLGLKGTF